MFPLSLSPIHCSLFWFEFFLKSLATCLLFLITLTLVLSYTHVLRVSAPLHLLSVSFPFSCTLFAISVFLYAPLLPLLSVVLCTIPPTSIFHYHKLSCPHAPSAPASRPCSVHSVSLISPYHQSFNPPSTLLLSILCPPSPLTFVGYPQPASVHVLLLSSAAISCRLLSL